MIEKNVAISWLTNFNEKIQANSAYLNTLDTPIGDGDHGANMARGMTAVIETLASKEMLDASEVFKVSGMQLLTKVGGASGPLYWSAFTGIAKGLSAGQSIDNALDSGLNDIKKRGNSDIGEKTLIDVWAPVIKSLSTGERLTDQAIDTFVDATKDLKASKGRASYLGDRSIGHIDPGAYSSGLFFKAMLESGGAEND